MSGFLCMGINATNWTQETINSTGWEGNRTDETITKGSPIGLLLLLTQAQSVDEIVNTYATDWDSTTVNATNWSNSNIFTDLIGLQSIDGLLLEDGGQLLIP